MNSFETFFLEHGHRLRQAELYARIPRSGHILPREESAYRVLIVRLSPWRDVEQSTPHHFLEGAVRRACPEAFVDHAFFPPAADLLLLEEHGISLLTGISSRCGAGSFNLILVSVSYVLELVNLPLLLSGSGLSPCSRSRGEDDPLILLGGSSAAAARAVIAADGDMYPDALYFGEGEGEVERIAAALYALRNAPRKTRLEALSGFPSVLTAGSAPREPGEGAVVAHRCRESSRESLRPSQAAEEAASDPAGDVFASTLLNGAEAGTVRLQISKGCPAFCTFCFESYDRKPYREIPAETVLAQAKALKRMTGADTLELYSFNFNTHTHILSLLLELNSIFYRVNYMSQRLDYLGSVSGLLEAEIRSGKRSFTLGVEGVSERIRTFYQKNIGERELHSVIEKLHAQKVRELKLFYVLSGYETEADLEEFRGFLKRFKTIRQNSPTPPRVVFSFNLLTRMPGTPLQYDRLFLREEDWKPIVSEVKCAVETHGFEYRLATRFDEYALAQVLVLGGDFTHDILRALHGKKIFFDGNMPEEAWPVAKKILDRNRVLESGFVQEKDETWGFPLDFVDTGVSRGFLHRAYLQSKQEKQIPSCLGRHCIGCDACADDAEKAQLAAHAVAHPEGELSSYLTRLGSLMSAKAKLVPLAVLLDTPPEISGAAAAWRNAWVTRELFRQYPELEDSLFSVQERYFSRKDNLYRYPPWFGTSLYAVYTSAPDLFVRLAGERSGGLNLRQAELLPGTAADLSGAEPAVLQGELLFDRTIVPDAGHAVERWLLDSHLPFSTRTVPGGKVLELSDKARKKRVLQEVRIERSGSAVRVPFTGTAKFSPAEILGAVDRCLVKTMVLNVKEFRL